MSIVLKGYLLDNYPNPNQIDNSTGQHNQQEFRTTSFSLFPLGCAFCSSIQLKQYCELFLSEWAVSKSCTGVRIKCFYCNPLEKKKV